MYWVEVHCDTSPAERDAIPPTPVGEPGCHTSAGKIFGARGHRARSAAVDARKAAMDAGWRRKGDRGLMCPACLKHAKLF